LGREVKGGRGKDTQQKTAVGVGNGGFVFLESFSGLSYFGNRRKQAPPFDP